MYLIIITGISIVLQFTAAALAMRLIRLTRNRVAWLLISIAMILMTIRRFIPFGHAIAGHYELVGLINELTAVVISIFLVVGMIKIAPIFTETHQANAAREQAENSLRESEINLWLAHEAADIGVWKSDLRTGTVYFDERARKHFGFSSLQVTQQEFVTHIHPEDQEAQIAVYEAARAPGSSGKIQTEHRVVPPGGEVRWVSIYGALVFEGQGAQRRSVSGYGTVQNITRRKQAEEGLLRSEERFSKAFHANPLPMIILHTAHDKMLVCNRAFELATGYCAEDLRGHFELVERVFGLRGGYREVLKQIRTAASENSYETTMRTRAGETREVLLSLEKITLQDEPCVLAAFLDITERKAAGRKMEEMNQVLREAYDQTILGWAHALDLRDHETEGHSRRVTELAMQMAREMGFPEAELSQLRWGALLHDIGKMGVPDQILLKPAVLSDEEWEIMRQHPQYAYDLLSPISFLRPVLDIPYCHHERWDGKGYPRGLKGEEIPLAARIFAVIDVWDALRSDRPYRSAWSRQETLNYITQEAGSHFDPAIAERFVCFMERESAR